MRVGLVRFATCEGVAREFPQGRHFEPSNSGLQQTPPSLSLGRRS
jgi:hypothetical protein